MRYLWNNKKEFCGVMYSNLLTIGTDKSVRPLRQGEKAIWNGEDWEYTFEVHEQKEEKDIIDYNDLGLAVRGGILNAVQPENGEETREHTGEISILIPCYNKKDFIKETAESALNQTQKPLHVIVLLMGEDVCMKSELEEMGCECVIHDRLNASDARTYLVQICPTDWFIFLDADDTLDSNFIEVLDKDDGAICFSAERWMKKGTLMCHPHARDNSLQHILSYNMTCLMHKDVFFDIGLDSSLASGGEDFDFQCRLLQMKKYKITRNTNTFFSYREGNGENLMDQLGFFRSLHRADSIHSSWLREELEKNRAADSYAAGKLYLDCIDDLNALSWNPYSDYNMSKAEQELRKKIENRLKSLFGLSRQRKPKGVYKAEDFITIGDVSFPEIELEGRAFDCVFIGRIDWEDASSVLAEKTMVLRKDIWEEVKDLNEYDRMKKLFLEYSCFEIGCDWQKERGVDTETLVSLVKNEEDFESFCEGYEKGGKLPIVEKQRVSFNISNECDKRCEYCSSGLEYKEDGITDEEVLLKNFEEALKKAEELCEKNGTALLPGIVGGEPTLMSESLQKGLLKKLEKYKRWELYTNGYDLSSPLATCSNADLIIHIVDWKNWEFPKKKYEPATTYMIVLCKGEVEDLKKFLERYEESEWETSFAICMNAEHDNALTESEIKEIVDLEKEHPVIKTIFNPGTLEGKTVEECYDFCRNHTRTWVMNCQSMKAQPCCAAGDAYEYKMIEDFTGERTKECDKCKLWHCIEE